MTQNHDDTDAMLNEMMARGRESQNIAVRTREEQIDALAKAIGPEKIYRLLSDEYRAEIDARALQHILEAEARGAAEQRRKDADGHEPAGYVSCGALEHLATKSGMRVQNLYGYSENAWPIPLYDHPANVAALEARVKELETNQRKDAQVIHWLAEKLKQTDPEAKSDYELLARAALTREGGV